MFSVYFCFHIFIIVPKVEATEEMKTKFTVTPVLPENQVSGTSSYYDLILAPKQSSTIVLDIKIRQTKIVHRIDSSKCINK